MTRYGLFACIMIAAVAPAFAHADELQRGESRAVLATATARPMEATIDGRIWQCDGAVCSAQPTDTADSQHIESECRHAASHLGAFTAYQTGTKVMTGAQLTDCNARLK